MVATPTTASDADAGRAVPGFVQAGLGGRTKSLWRGLSRRRTDDGSGGAAEWTGGAAELQALLRDGGVRVEKQMRSAAPFRSSSFAWQARRLWHAPDEAALYLGRPPDAAAAGSAGAAPPRAIPLHSVVDVRRAGLASSRSSSDRSYALRVRDDALCTPLVALLGALVEQHQQQQRQEKAAPAAAAPAAAPRGGARAGTRAGTRGGAAGSGAGRGAGRGRRLAALRARARSLRAEADAAVAVAEEARRLAAAKAELADAKLAAAREAEAAVEAAAPAEAPPPAGGVTLDAGADAPAP